MLTRQLWGAARPWNPKTIVPIAIFAGVSGVAALGSAQEVGDETTAEVAPQAAASEAESTPEAPEEPPAADANEPAPTEAEEEPPVEEPADDPAPAEEPDAVEPLPAGEETEPGVEEDPDYFGSYDPIAPTLRSPEDFTPPKPRYQGPFRAGRFRLGLSIGGGTIGNDTYFIPGASVGYFLVNGLEVHLDTDFWLIGDPFLATPSPGLRYVFWMLPKVHPYVGAFYRHYFVGSGFDDADSVGARGGVYFMTGRSSYFGIGVAYERMLVNEIFVDDEFIYPEVVFAFAF